MPFPCPQLARQARQQERLLQQSQQQQQQRLQQQVPTARAAHHFLQPLPRQTQALQLLRQMLWWSRESPVRMVSGLHGYRH